MLPQFNDDNDELEAVGVTSIQSTTNKIMNDEDGNNDHDENNSNSNNENPEAQGIG